MSSLGTALVTGAANGIGRAVADALDALGYLVVGLDVEPADRPHARRLDVADIEGHEALVADGRRGARADHGAGQRRPASSCRSPWPT